ncbi:MAG: S8 family peptidase [Myxococcota bacterium]
MISIVLSSISLAIPFHESMAVNDHQLRIGSQLFDVKNAVIVYSETPHPTWTSIGGPFYRISTASAKEAIELATEMKLDDQGLFTWPDIVLHHHTQSFNDPLYEGQWYLDFLEMSTLHQSTLGDSGIRLAVIDSGIDIAHPDLLQHIEPRDTHGSDADPSPEPGEFCYDSSDICDDHGTAVSGIMLATANNQTGMVGLCPDCTLIPIKMLGEGNGSLSSDIAAFEHAITHDAAVINNSWGYVMPTVAPDALAESIRRAQTIPRNGLGALVVFAAGNDDREIIDGELCTLPEVLCVSAIDSYGRPTAYTNFGAAIDVAAPSATVSIAPNENTTVTFGGTSAAAPVVSGLAGWALSIDPSLSSGELHNLMLQSATPSPLVTHDENGHHPDYGYGVVTAVTLKSLLEDEPSPEADNRKTGCASFPAIPLMILPLFWGIFRSPLPSQWNRQ